MSTLRKLVLMSAYGSFGADAPLYEPRKNIKKQGSPGVKKIRAKRKARKSAKRKSRR